MTTTEILCDFLVDTGYSDIPGDAVRIAKERILDTVGVALAGAVEPAGAGRIAIELVKELGGYPTSTVIAGGFKTSAPNAGLANGTGAATLDYDDTTTYTICHYSSSLIPAVLALAEETKVSGRKLLEAFILAWEAGTRIGECMGAPSYYQRGFHTPGTWACLGCAAASAKLLNCSREQVRTALAVAASAAGGIRKTYGTNTKPLHSGYSARNGIIAAMLAKKGFTADRNVLDRDPEAKAHMCFSFPVVFAGEGNYNLSKVTEGLGKSYNLVSKPIVTKFHPGPTAMAPFIELVIDMMKRNSIRVDQVEKVEVRAIREWVEGVSPFLRPRTGDEARYSAPYQIAVAMLDGQVGIEQHREERVHSYDVQEMMQRVHLSELKGSEAIVRKLRETANIAKMGIGELTIKLKDGREFIGKVERGQGSSPLKRQDLLAKYEDCAKRVLSLSDVKRSIELIENLENLDDVTELMDLLRG
ncbi:MAG: MmgE/PrpD family protein [Chloroflexi bacterium]|nr:MmgE/PrpD family protein [Chloroflexota bacterium]